MGTRPTGRSPRSRRSGSPPSRCTDRAAGRPRAGRADHAAERWRWRQMPWGRSPRCSSWPSAAGCCTGGGGVAARRRRGRHAPSRQPAQLSGPELRQRANALLIATDERIRDARQEIDFAEAQYGPDAVGELRRAVADAQGELAASFTLRQKLDDDVPEDEAARDAMLREIVERTTRALGTLDAETADIRGLRDLERDAPRDARRAARSDRGRRGPAAGGARGAGRPATATPSPRGARWRATSRRSRRGWTGRGRRSRSRVPRWRATTVRPSRSRRARRSRASPARPSCSTRSTGSQQASPTPNAGCRPSSPRRNGISARPGPSARTRAPPTPGSTRGSARSSAPSTPPMPRRRPGRPTRSRRSGSRPRRTGSPTRRCSPRATRRPPVTGSSRPPTRRSAPPPSSTTGPPRSSRRAGPASATAARTRLAEAQRNLEAATAVAAQDPAAAIERARRAQQLAGEAYQLAASDFSGWDSGGPGWGQPPGRRRDGRAARPDPRRGHRRRHPLRRRRRLGWLPVGIPGPAGRRRLPGSR